MVLWLRGSWVIFVVYCNKQEAHKELFELLRWTLNAVGVHFRLLYNNGIWLPAEKANIAIEAGFKMLDAGSIVRHHLVPRL